MKKYDLVVNIGRFEPWHNGHDLLDDFSASMGRQQLILLGSCFQARTPKNPFTGEERASMIRFRKAAKNPASDVRIEQLRDFHYSDQLWAAQVQDKVQQVINEYSDFFPNNPKIALVGHKKDESSYYLSMFPQWEFVEYKPELTLDATTIRNILFEKGNGLHQIEDRVPLETKAFLYHWIQNNRQEFDQLCKEYAYYRDYSKKWGLGPHTTVDSLVTCCGHVLLIQRGQDPDDEDFSPGQGLWALPGGFLGRNERIIDGVLRELKEETSINVPNAVLKGSVVGTKIADFPGRSLRGRVISHVFHMHLWDTKLPKVKAASDAKKAVWKPLSWISANPHLFFEDHWQLIQGMITGGGK